MKRRIFTSRKFISRERRRMSAEPTRVTKVCPRNFPTRDATRSGRITVGCVFLKSKLSAAAAATTMEDVHVARWKFLLANNISQTEECRFLPARDSHDADYADAANVARDARRNLRGCAGAGEIRERPEISRMWQRLAV